MKTLSYWQKNYTFMVLDKANNNPIFALVNFYSRHLNMNFTPEQVAAHFREWADLVKSTYNHSNRQIAEKIGVSRSTFDNIYYETANAKRASRDPKYLVALAFCYPDILKSKAQELGLDVPDPPTEKKESREIELLKKEIQHYKNLLDSYKLSNESMQKQIGNKEDVIQKLTDTISELSKKLGA